MGTSHNTSYTAHSVRPNRLTPTSEEKNGMKFLLLLDERSNVFYLNCHLDSNVLASKTDLEAVLDPTESEDYKLNREIYTDTYAYRLELIRITHPIFLDN